jgi:mono/diheme cytochrome c family protein
MPHANQGRRLRPEKSTRFRRGRLAASLVLLAAVAGCRQDMHDQPKYRPLRASAFFENTSSARPLVEGTIARGTLQSDAPFFTGKNGAMLVTELPFPVTQAVLDRGQERFNIYCTPCHGATGSGNGLVVQRGYPQPQTYHSDRLRQIEAGYFFDVMTNGFGRMPDYRAQISPRDRWNIVAYIRALQLSQHAATSDVPGGDPTKLAKPAATAHEPAKH